jgi:hypothetical protein
MGLGLAMVFVAHLDYPKTPAVSRIATRMGDRRTNWDFDILASRNESVQLASRKLHIFMWSYGLGQNKYRYVSCFRGLSSHSRAPPGLSFQI